jgi:hypothetical protein
MCKIAPIVAAVFALICSIYLTSAATADEGPIIRHGKKIRHICLGRHCGPYTPCGVRCRVVCPDRYSCYPLYGAYGPYGGTRFWGAYTYSGWGYR